MEIAFFLTADYANLTGDGKINIMGIFNRITATQFPARHPSLFVIAKLLAGLGEEGQTRDVHIYLHDPDGKKLLNIGGEMSFPERILGQKPEINVIANLRDVVFPVPGPYQFNLFVDRDHKSQFSLSVEISSPLGPSEK